MIVTHCDSFVQVDVAATVTTSKAAAHSEQSRFNENF